MKRRCKTKESVIVTTPNGISTILFGLWLKAEHNESILFINVLEKDESSNEEIDISAAGALGTIMAGSMPEMEQYQGSYGEASEANALVEYNNAKYTCPELDSLDLTWRQQDMG